MAGHRGQLGRQRGPRRVALAELLAAAPPELADQVRGELLAVGLDPDASGWPL
jgi:hypothetical protein